MLLDIVYLKNNLCVRIKLILLTHHFVFVCLFLLMSICKIKMINVKSTFLQTFLIFVYFKLVYQPDVCLIHSISSDLRFKP